MNKKWFALIGYGIVITMVYLHANEILGWLRAFGHSHNPMEYILHIAGVLSICIVFATVPVIPYPVVAGIIGAAFDLLTGFFLVWTGTLIATTIMFLVFRFLIKDWARKLIDRQEHMQKWVGFFEKNAFVAIMMARAIPIIPASLVNAMASISNISFIRFVIASGLGKFPANLLYVSIGYGISGNINLLIIVVIAYIVFLGGGLMFFRKRNPVSTDTKLVS